MGIFYVVMSNIKFKERSLQIRGRVKIETYKAGMVERVMPYLDMIREHRDAARGLSRSHKAFRSHHLDRIQELKILIDSIKRAHFRGTPALVNNLVMDSPNYGLDLIIQRLTGNNTYSLNLLWIELGTGTTAPTVNDTGLSTPSIRLPVSYQEDYGATDAIVQAYVADANLTNATYGEVGSFVDGNASIGTGQLFNHALISPTFAKVSGEDVTVEIDVSIMNS